MSVQTWTASVSTSKGATHKITGRRVSTGQAYKDRGVAGRWFRSLMISLRKPTLEVVQAFVATQVALDLSYPDVGATATTPPAGYNVDRTRVRLGEGDRAFDAARAALHRWEQFNL